MRISSKTGGMMSAETLIQFLWEHFEEEDNVRWLQDSARFVRLCMKHNVNIDDNNFSEIKKYIVRGDW